MLTPRKLYNRLTSIDTNEIAFESMDQTSDEIAELNRSQLFEGKDANGENIGLYRNEEYAVYKNQLNPVPGFGNVDLKLTGDFYNRIDTNIVGDAVITESTDSKNSDLVGKYGSDIFGLSIPKKVIYIRDSLRPVFNGRISDFLGLKFN